MARNLGFLTARAWLDADGRHVWLRHDCTHVREQTMLPWPTWRADGFGRVVPSVSCDFCGLHAILVIEDPPLDCPSPT